MSRIYIYIYKLYIPTHSIYNIHIYIYVCSAFYEETIPFSSMAIVSQLFSHGAGWGNTNTSFQVRRPPGKQIKEQR